MGNNNIILGGKNMNCGILLKAGIIGMIVMSAMAGSYFVSLPSEKYIKEEQPLQWLPLDFPAVGDNSPGEYGWLNFSVTANSVFDFATNISDTSDPAVLGSTDVNQTTAGEYVNHSTALELSLKILLNVTWEDDSGTFQKDYLRCWVNCTDTTPAIDTELATIINVTGTEDPNHYWVYAVVDNSGSGYTITDGQHVDSVEWKFEGYYVAGTL